MACALSTIDDDTFYQTITLGLLTKLRNMENVTNVQIERRIPCNRLMISAWEHSYGVCLPDDLKEFYAATDGFKFTWELMYYGDTKIISDITINALSNLNKLGDLNKEYGNWVELFSCRNSINPLFKGKYDAFVLNSCKNIGKVCLIYRKDETTDSCIGKPQTSIWLLDKTYQWHWLSENFAVYFRMVLVHMGLPQWQLRFTSMGLTPAAEQIMKTIAPHLLQTENSPTATYQNQLNLNLLKESSASKSKVHNKSVNKQ